MQSKTHAVIVSAGIMIAANAGCAPTQPRAAQGIPAEQPEATCEPAPHPAPPRTRAESLADAGEESSKPPADAGSTTQAESSSPQSQPVEEQRIRLGETATHAHYKLSAHNVRSCQPRHYEKAALQERGFVLIGVELSVESLSDKPLFFGTYGMKLVDTEGYVHKSSSRGNCEPRLRTVRLERGDRTRGWVTVEVPATAAGLKLTYDPPIILGPRQITKIDLGR